MDQTYIRDLAHYVGEEVTIKGWLYNLRSSGKLKFPQIRDGSGIVQGVVSKRDVSEQVWNDFDGHKASLTQSGQRYNEATAAAFGKVYTFGPTFRAEKSKTRRHLTEFWMVEPEVAYAELDDVMNLAEDFLSFIVGRVLENRQAELKELERDIAKLEKIQKPFPRLQYDEAVRMLQEGFEKGELETRFEWGGDFGAPDETYISSQYDRPVMVHRYPAAVKAFYMKPDPERADLALCVDVLAPEGYGEVIGGGQRAEDL